ncbi:hypothetical protein HN51_041093 [Arachis hypogaea]
MNENPKLQHHRRRRRRVAVAASPSPPQPQPQPFISLPLVPMPQCASTISLPLLSHLPPNADGGDAAPQLLIPGCGNSRLSEHLYDAGYTGLTNIDFSKVVISDMLRRNVRLRPHIRWRVMDMTNMQLEDESFDAIIDKGGLDALMEPELGPKLGNQYLSEVKRVLKPGGKFLCLTLAESHVLGKKLTWLVLEETNSGLLKSTLFKVPPWMENEC